MYYNNTYTLRMRTCASHVYVVSYTIKTMQNLSLRNGTREKGVFTGYDEIQVPQTANHRGSRSRTQPLASVFFQEKDVTPDPKLFEKVSECDRRLAIARHQECPLAHLSPELSDIFDFFIALTICNTVVVTSPDQPRQKASSEVSP